MSDLTRQDTLSKAEEESLELVPLRALNELVYCSRLHHLMYVQGIFVESADTIEGSSQHRRAERRRPKRSRSSEEKETDPEASVSPWPAPPTELYLGSSSLGLVGKLDALKVEDGLFVPVEYKRGTAPAQDRVIGFEDTPLPPGAWPGDQVQVAAQVMLLEANAYPSRYGLLHYRASHSTVRIDVTDRLRELVRLVASRAPYLDGPEPMVY